MCRRLPKVTQQIRDKDGVKELGKCSWGRIHFHRVVEKGGSGKGVIPNSSASLGGNPPHPAGGRAVTHPHIRGGLRWPSTAQCPCALGFVQLWKPEPVLGLVREEWASVLPRPSFLPHGEGRAQRETNTAGAVKPRQSETETHGQTGGPRAGRPLEPNLA